MTNPEPWKWLETTRQLQIEAYGKDPGELEGDERGSYWSDMHTALVDELSEFLAEVSWKPWANGRGEIKNREAALGELVDAGHFLANLLISINATDKEWEAAYQEKQARNKARQERDGGYDNDALKCPECRRELDKEGAYTVVLERDSIGIDSYLLECAACKLVFDFDGELP